jgi:hypothetical protein
VDSASKDEYQVRGDHIPLLGSLSTALMEIIFKCFFAGDFDPVEQQKSGRLRPG